MRRMPESADNLTVIGLFLGQIAMRIHDHRDWQIRPNEFADFADDRMLAAAPFQSEDIASAMQEEKHPVNLVDVFAHAVQELFKNEVERFPGDAAPSPTVCVNRRNDFDSGFLKQIADIQRVDDVIAGFHHKILQRTRLFHAGVRLGDKAAN